ncbi:hypothetical protein ACGFNU_37340 [Spirillospora sp. NPDC048911]
MPFRLGYRARVLRARPKRLDSICLLDPHASPALLDDGVPVGALA